MCGFAAVIATDGERPDPGLLARMSALLAHRGPDGHGTFAEHAFAVGFRRLAILDLAPSGHQPMFSPDGRHVIVYNGEIYNYLELRDELVSRGHSFRSSGDTEVLLAAYREWGADCLGRLNGMWAFLIYDRESRRVFGARDRFGIKPLYCYRDAGRLVFASEIKAVRDSGVAKLSPDHGTIARFLLEDRLDDSERTFYQGVEQVPAGTAFEVDDSARMRSWRYWSIPATPRACADPARAYRELFDDAIRIHMRSDVSLGVQLSGGLDSTSIVCRTAWQLAGSGRSAGDLQAFCYLSPDFDETEQIEATLRQTAVRQIPLDARPDELWASIERHLWHQDEPVHSFTSVVGYQLMALARTHDVRVLLNGQGADEVLAGYPNYFLDYWTELVRTGRLRVAEREIAAYAAAHRVKPRKVRARVLARVARQLLARLPGHAQLARARRRGRIGADAWVSGELKRQWVADVPVEARGLDAVLRRSVETSPLPLFLRVEDRNAMAHGVEVRLPFLDHRLVSFAFGAAPEWKLKGPCTKRLLREAMNGQIPEVVRTQHRKYGFPTSVESWFRRELHEPFQDLLASRLVRESGLWNCKAVAAALEQHRRGERNHGARLFDVAQLSQWMEGSRNWPTAAPRQAGAGTPPRHAPAPGH